MKKIDRGFDVFLDKNNAEIICLIFLILCFVII